MRDVGLVEGAFIKVLTVNGTGLRIIAGFFCWERE